MSQMGAILVSNTQEYHNNRHGNGANEMHVDFPFYFGTVPSDIPISMLRVSYPIDIFIDDLFNLAIRSS